MNDRTATDLVPFVKRDVDGRGIVTLTLDRPQSFNALSEGMLAALQDELDAVALDDKVRAVVIAATGKAFEGGWFHTGDLAVLEPDRYVKIKDRSKDVIISGGENISSLEVEDALYRHPDVLACAVVARPDPKWGETPLAFVELRGGASVSAPELVAHCRALLAGYKVPREIRFEAIPKTSTGKIQKFQLRERARSARAIE